MNACSFASSASMFGKARLDDRTDVVSPASSMREARSAAWTEAKFASALVARRSIGDTCRTADRGSAMQPHRNSTIDNVQHVPRDPVHERRVIRTGQVEDLADIQPPSAMPNSVNISTVPTRAPASFGEKYSRMMIAYDGHDAALEQAEQRRYDVQRPQSVRRQEQQQRQALQRRPDAAASTVRRCDRRCSRRSAGSRCRSPASARASARRAQGRSRDRRTARRCAPAASTSPRSTPARRGKATRSPRRRQPERPVRRASVANRTRRGIGRRENAGGRPRMNIASAAMLTTQNTPMPRYVARQPAVCDEVRARSAATPRRPDSCRSRTRHGDARAA